MFVSWTLIHDLVICVVVFASSTLGSVVTAKGKPVSSSSIRDASQGPEKAIDGDTRATVPYLFHTEPFLSLAWWSVDLGEVVDSPKITIYFRTEGTGRRNGVRTSLSPAERSDNDFCHVITGAADGSDIPAIYNFICAARGRYLNISTVTDNYGFGAVLDFGEVEVYACSLYTFGPGCSSECHCAEESCNWPWSLETPTCPARCLPGWKSAACDTLVSASEVSVCMKPANTCDVPINFNFEPVALMSVLEMESLNLESRIECSHNCAALVLCVSFEYTASTCTLWRAGSSGLSGSRDMWKK